MSERRQYRSTIWPGIYVLHERRCPAEDNDRAKCACDARWRGRRRSPVTKKPVWQTPPASTKAAAMAWLDADTTAVEERVARGMSFGSLGDEWMEGVQRGVIQRRRRGRPLPYSATTVRSYRRDLLMLKDPERGGFADQVAAEITEDDWQEFFQELRDRGLSFSRLANIRSVTSSIYAWAGHRTRRKRTGVIDNPMHLIDLGANTGKRRERVALLEEAAELLDALEPRDRVPFAIAFYAGPRRGAIGSIAWPDVEIVAGRVGSWLHINSIDDELGPGKTGDGRWVPVSPLLRTILQAEFERQGRPTEGKVVSVSLESGKLGERVDQAWAAANKRKAERLERPLRPRARHEAWSAEHELQPIRLHECRHTYCSWLVASKKWDIAEVMEFMGHTQLSTTQRYIHTIREHGPRKQADVVDLFGGQAQSG